MSDQMSATIISFPGMRAAPTALAPVPARASADIQDPQQRLQRALAALDRAVADQRIAVAKWRDSLGQLRGSVQGLGQSLGRYNERLSFVAEEMRGLHREARRLEALADGFLGAEAIVATSES